MYNNKLTCSSNTKYIKLLNGLYNNCMINENIILIFNFLNTSKKYSTFSKIKTN